MFLSQFKRFQPYIIFIILVCFMGFAIWIRSLTALLMNLPQYLTFSSPDIWYNFRQIELMVQNYPVYSWFDPMTAYPTGKSVDWGPFLPFVTATLAVIIGMTSRLDMMYLSSWVIPIFAAIMVPITYFIGKHLWDWKTGIIASGLISVTSGIYFITSSFGYVDHHILEAVFGTLFCLMYILTLKYCKKNSQDFKIRRTLFVFLGLSLLTALVYFVGFLNMPTILIFGSIVAIYTFFQFIWDRLTNKLDNSLVLTNIGIFSFLVVFMLFFGVKQAGFSLQQYSIGHTLAILFIIVETLVMYALSKWLNRNKGIYVLAVIVVCAVSLLSILAISKETLYQMITLFGQSEDTSTIIELEPWNLNTAFSSFNLMVVLSIVGFGILIYHLYTKKRQEHLFFLIWSLIIFSITVQHLRYEYYFAVNVTLLSSLCIVTGLTIGFANIGVIKTLFPLSKQVVTETHDKSPVSKKKIKNPEKSTKKLKGSFTSKKVENKRVLGVVIILVIFVATVISVGLSIQNDLKYSGAPVLLISNNWVETTEWLEAHTPDPGVDYLGVYQKDLFSYPDTAYGVLSWWDYGHYITFIGKRIPVTNPFQDHLLGPEGAASFYISNSEANATKILQSTGSRYVITDTSLATDKFVSLVSWNQSKADTFAYMKSFFTQTPAKSGQLFQLNGEFPPYFHTTVVRLHNFDGSLQIPEKVAYLEYSNEKRNGLFYPMVSTAQFLNVTDATKAMRLFEQQPQGNSQAVLIGQFLQPLERVPALQHFRLVHESPGNSSGLKIYDNSGAENLKEVKVFEFVKGARIKGDGVIEVQIVTNTGRIFTYQQEGNNGEFVVPYSTVNNPYEVQANGKYHIIGTNIGIEVTEEDVVEGKDVKY